VAFSALTFGARDCLFVSAIVQRMILKQVGFEAGPV
jgi:hypothetical protein